MGALHPGGEYQAPRDPFDLYSARFVKGKGTEKMGLCPICIEPQHRGGVGKKVWLSMKFSAFKWSVVVASLFVVPLMRCPLLEFDSSPT